MDGHGQARTDTGAEAPGAGGVWKTTGRVEYQPATPGDAPVIPESSIHDGIAVLDETERVVAILAPPMPVAKFAAVLEAIGEGHLQNGMFAWVKAKE